MAAKQMVVSKVLTRCTACGSSDVDSVMELPNFPMTGIYVADPTVYSPLPDNTLMLCHSCGHGFLQNVIDSQLLYEHNCGHSSTASPIACAGNDFFWQFIRDFDSGKSYQCAVEIGCNDFYLTNYLSAVCEYVVGIDPQWRGRKVDIKHSNLTVLGKRVDEIIPESEIPVRPDLIVAVHTLEHIAEPLNDLGNLVNFAAHDALIAVAVPCFDRQIQLLRFDQIFHQHIQYFCINSLVVMLNRLGCAYIKHTFDYNFWNGTLVALFKKSTARPALQHNFATMAEVVKARDRFLDRCKDAAQQIGHSDQPIYAYGASQILPTIAYHLGTDMGEFRGILDQNPARAGKYFPGIFSQIIPPHQVYDIREATIFITALDYAREIIGICIEKKRD